MFLFGGPCIGSRIRQLGLVVEGFVLLSLQRLIGIGCIGMDKGSSCTQSRYRPEAGNVWQTLPVPLCLKSKIWIAAVAVWKG
jgi:hypothetical protein